MKKNYKKAVKKLQLNFFMQKSTHFEGVPKDHGEGSGNGTIDQATLDMLIFILWVQ